MSSIGSFLFIPEVYIYALFPPFSGSSPRLQCLRLAAALPFLFLRRAPPPLDLRRLRAFPGVDHVEIDFPIRLRIGTNDVVVLTDPFPSDLVLVAGQLGIPLRFTIWPPLPIPARVPTHVDDAGAEGEALQSESRRGEP